MVQELLFTAFMTFRTMGDLTEKGSWRGFSRGSPFLATRALRQETVRGALQTAIPLPFVLGAWVHGDAAILNGTATLGFAVSSSLLLAISAHMRSRRSGSAFLPYLALSSLLPLLWRAAVERPMVAFFVVIVAAVGSRYFRSSSLPLAFEVPVSLLEVLDRQLLGASVMVTSVWLLASALGKLGTEDLVSSIALLTMLLLVLLRGGIWIRRRGWPRHVRSAIIYGAHGLTLGLIGIAWLHQNFLPNVLSVAAVFPAAFLAFGPFKFTFDEESIDWTTPIVDHPERFLIATFLGLVVVGTILLVQPSCSGTGREIHLIDATFTSVSAVCVTGLIVLDTPNDFSFAGQLTILVLIQLGGIGMMAFSATAFRMLGRRMSLRHEAAVSRLVVGSDRSRLFETARTILLFTFVVELIGALILMGSFVRCGDSFPNAAWRGIFTSVSAFCNAGFALQSDSLVPYRSHPAILHTVGLLILLGGLSPVLALSAPSLLVGRGASTSLQGRIALAGTVVLLLVGFVFIGAIEWNRSLGGLSVGDRLHNAWFQSVTLRTAGFNSVDIGAVHPGTLALMMVWMFIGACSGGTAGGIKVTTAVVLLLAVVSAIRGESQVSGWGRTIARETVHKAMAISAMAASAAFLFYLVLQLTQGLPEPMALFEIFSALGTVGLSTGATARIDGVGKLVIMLCMFAGRVGPISLFMLLRERNVQSGMKWPEEAVEVG